MIWIIIFGSAAALVSLWLVYLGITEEDSGIFEGLFLGLIMSLIAFTVASLLAFLGNVMSTIWVGGHWEETSTTSIRSINDTSKTSGKFFLGSGSVDSQPVFWYYVDLGTHSELRQTYASDARIVETSDEPRLVESEFVTNDRFWTLDAMGPGGSNERYTFYVPEDSITNDFVLDSRP